MANESKRIGKGYCGRVLHVDLSTSAISTQELDEAFYQKYLGGLGLGAKILWDRIKPGVDPVGPDNVLGFTAGGAVGPLVTGYIYDVTESYRIAFLVCAFVGVAGIILSTLLRPPRDISHKTTAI